MITLREQNILFFLRASMHGGTENVVIQLCEIFKPVVNKVIVCAALGFKKEKLGNLRVKFYEIPDIEKKNLKTIRKVLKIVSGIIRAENITVIHTHHRMAAFYAYILSYKYDVIFINTSHNTFTDKRFLTRLAYKKLHLIACGEMVKKNLAEFYRIPENRITVIRNAVQPFRKPIIDDDLIKDLHSRGYFIVGNIGRLSEQKGMVYYIKAIPDVLKVHPDVRFLIIGGGEEEEKLKNLVNELGMERAVYFTGYCADVQNLMAQLDLVVLSSLWEGFPLTPIEAFSVGKTIIATAVDGAVEIVEDGKTGMLISPRSSSQIAEKIIWAIEHPYEIKCMEKAAKQKFKREFSFDNLKENYVDYYKRVIIDERAPEVCGK